MKNTSLLMATVLCASILITSCTTSDNGKDEVTGVGVVNSQHDEPTIDISGVKDGWAMPLNEIAVSGNKSGLRVTMKNIETGHYVKADQKDGIWYKDEPLGYGQAYLVNAKMGDKTQQWQVKVPSVTTAESSLAPMDGSTVGIGQTIAVKFDVAVPDRAAAEKAIDVKTEPKVDGKFHWVSPTEVRWRPEHFWKPGTSVHVDVNTYGKKMGDGIWGGANQSTSFTIGSRTVTIVDDNTKQANVFRNGKVIKSFPVSLGGPGNETPNGIYFLGDHNESMVMDSETYGLSHEAGGYRLDVDDATQMSYSGIYLHSAPWAAGAIGSYNQSHGCINAMPDYAKWFRENTARGDVVIVKNTAGPVLDGNDGLGDWNIPWSQW